MITDDELEALMQEAGGAVAVPAHGPAAILATAAPSASEGEVVRGRLRLRELVLAGTSVAAVVALAVVLLTSQGASSPLGAAAPRSAINPTASGTPVVFGPANGSITKTVTSGTQGASSSVARGREIIATGKLRLDITRAALRRDVELLDAFASRFGGYVSAAHLAESGPHPGGTIVVAVPARSFSPFIAHAEGVGRVRNLAITDTDVTAQVVDLGARLTALVDERSQLEVILGRSGKISDLLSVENEIESVQSEIEQIQGEQRTIATQVSYSSLTVDLVIPQPPHVSGPSNGFGHAWHEAVSGFVSGVKALVAHLGDVVFGVLLLIIVSLIVFGLWRSAWTWVRRRIA